MNSMIDFTAVDAMRYTALIASIGISVSIFEDLSSFHHFTKNGLLSWDISKLRVKWTAGGKASRAVDFVMSSSIYRLILVTILVPSVLMPITLLFDELLFPLCLIILVGIILNMMRNVYGLDGSDHMNLVVFSAIVISSLSPPDSFAQSIGLWFIALQYVLSMLISGVYKLLSYVWRSGEAMLGIMSTISYGNPRFYQMLNTHPTLPRILCWGVIVTECVFPMIFFVGSDLEIVFLTIGVALHAVIAITMGLNNFFWAFVATYPAIWFCLQ